MKIGLTNIVSCKIGSTQVNRVYIGSTLIWSYSAFDPDAQLFITNAAITDPVQQNTVNNLVINLKNYGIWTKMKALYPFVGGTANQHKFNLRNPLDTDAAFRLVFNGGWTHSSTGSTPNGVNAFANTFYKPFANGLKDSAHISYYSRTNVSAGGAIDMGSLTAAPGYYHHMHIRQPGDLMYGLLNTESAAALSNSITQGLFIASRITSTTTSLYRNITNLGTVNLTSTATYPNLNIYIGAGNNVNVASQFSTKETAFNSIGDGLTDTEAANYYTAVQTFQTTLNRQVGVPIVADADAQAFLNAAVIENVTQASAVNTLVTDLKGYGIWTKMKALYPFVGGTASQHKFNLKNPLDTDAAFRLVFNGGWTHSSTGALPNGVNGFADTRLLPSAVQTLNSNSIGYYVRTLNTSASTDPVQMGVFEGGTQRSILHQLNNSATLATALNGTPILGTVSNATGLFTSSKTSSTITSIYKNNTLVSSGASGGDLPQLYNILIGNMSISATAYGNGWVNNQFAFAFIGDGFNSTEQANLYTAVQAFQTTLGRQV